MPLAVLPRTLQSMDPDRATGLTGRLVSRCDEVVYSCHSYRASFCLQRLAVPNNRDSSISSFIVSTRLIRLLDITTPQFSDCRRLIFVVEVLRMRFKRRGSMTSGGLNSEALVSVTNRPSTVCLRSSFDYIPIAYSNYLRSEPNYGHGTKEIPVFSASVLHTRLEPALTGLSLCRWEYLYHLVSFRGEIVIFCYNCFRGAQIYRSDNMTQRAKHASGATYSNKRHYIVLAIIIACLLALVIGLAAGLSLRRKNSHQNLQLPTNYGGVYDGDLTYYAPGLGACGMKSSESDMIVAVSHLLFDSVQQGSNPNTNPLCGMKLRARRPDGDRSIALKVVDRCTGCQYRDLDVSPGAFRRLAEIAQGRVSVEWAWLENVVENITTRP